MSQQFKALVVILAIALATLHFLKPIALRFTLESDYSRRRKLWLALTVIAFLCPNFWIFTLFAVPLLYFSGRQDTNPVAFYLFLFQVIPAVAIEIPTPGDFRLFSLDIYRLLALCVLLPCARRIWRSAGSADSPDTGQGRKLTRMDYLLLGYGLMQVIVFIPPDLPGHVLLKDSPTNVLRRAVLFLLDDYVLYYVISRSCRERRQLVDAFAAFCLASAVMAAIAVFEYLRHWLLYAGMQEQWGAKMLVGTFMLRGGGLRAQAAAGGPIPLGCTLAVAIGFWLYLRGQFESRKLRIGLLLLLCAGLIATSSRGPWVGAVVIYFAFAALGPRAVSGVWRAAGVGVFAAAVASLTPFGKRIVSLLPFVGSAADSDTVTYRSLLADRSWELIQQNPLFGDPLAMTKMEDLRQGQGIIDMVNTYAQIALFYGIVGLALIAGFMLIGWLGTVRLSRRIAAEDPDYALFGASLGACIVGLLVIMATCSFIYSIDKLYFVLAGLAACYLSLGATTDPNRTQPGYAAEEHGQGLRA